ncbi:alpha-ketoglutarate-dependent dioxygenase AlkB family protein [Pseudomonas asuensis]|uniref:Alpha-ketoglutarate-dependent dioxygenase AlkB n=1 Tax=Pseudomonas asuensis TaxID=1825787 RepID=A0ABQ2H2V4_9PSED|nr:alpha-ketoglutarate-dependent dioxygenase AlkB [Pseudomonas asuensis]GGM26991.1 alpha-ketoglutarate-dependent dioxygenase AlkB [Pseudomonas asuensis]
MIQVDLPDADILFYEHWVASGEANDWLIELIRQTPWEQPQVRVYGKSYSTPRLVAWYSDPGIDYEYSSLAHPSLPWTALLDEIRGRVSQFCEHPFNGVLINYYRNGQDAMGWHSDNEAVLGKNPTIASLSLGVARRFDLRRRGAQRIEHSIELTHGSLLIMRGATQHYWQHQVARTMRSISPRLNLTFRWIRT